MRASIAVFILPLFVSHLPPVIFMCKSPVSLAKNPDTRPGFLFSASGVNLHLSLRPAQLEVHLADTIETDRHDESLHVRSILQGLRARRRGACVLKETEKTRVVPSLHLAISCFPGRNAGLRVCPLIATSRHVWLATGNWQLLSNWLLNCTFPNQVQRDDEHCKKQAQVFLALAFVRTWTGPTPWSVSTLVWWRQARGFVSNTSTRPPPLSRTTARGELANKHYTDIVMEAKYQPQDKKTCTPVLL